MNSNIREHLSAKHTFCKRTAVCCIYALLLVTAYLWYVGSEGYGSLFEAKKALFTYMHAVFIALFAVAALVDSTNTQCDFKPNRIPLMPVALSFCYTVVVWVSDLKSWYWPRVLDNMEYYGECTIVVTIYTMVFILLAMWLKPSRLLFVCFVLSVGGNAIVCILQTIGVNPLGLYRGGIFFGLGDGLYYQGQYTGTIGNSNFTSELLAMSVCIVVAYMILSEGSKRFLLLMPILLCAYAMFSIDADQGTVAALVTVFLFCVFVLCKDTKVKAAICVLGVVVILVALCCIYFFVEAVDFTYPVSPSAIRQLRELLHGNFSPKLATGRVGLWAETIARIPNRFYWGYGSQSMIWADFPPSTRHSVEQGMCLESRPAAAHNIYLNIWYSNGIFALLLYVILLVWCAYKWLRLAHRSKDVAALGCGIVSWSVQGLFAVSNITITPYFWLLLALYLPAVKSAELADK